jgi:mannose-1-phosphate guanylyltransferase
MTSALILAAGFGTRLRPLTLELPKPVVPVGDRPLLAHVAAACRRAGALHLVVNLHHDHQKIRNIIEYLDLKIEAVVEPSIRGTAGGVTGAASVLGPGAVLVWNGDILTDAPARQLLEVATAHDAMVLAVAPTRGREGSVGLDASGHVVRLRGRVFGREAQSADYVGVMALGPGVVARLPEQGCLFGDFALPYLAEGGVVRTVATLAPWTDLGDCQAYVAANFAWLAERGAESFVASDVEWAPGVEVERSVIGVGAKLLGSGRVRDVVAWPGATVTAPLERAVVLGSGRVVPFP